MALSRRAKVTAGVIGLTFSAFFAAAGSAYADDDEGVTELVIVESAPAAGFAHSADGCDKGGSTSTVADAR